MLLSPPFTRSNPLLTLQGDDEMDSSKENASNQVPQVSQKIPPIYEYNISSYENFYTSLCNITFEEFSIANTKSALKLNLNSTDDYRTATKLFDDSGIEYHTYQFQKTNNYS
ncbi:Uncharacterized protein FWK35_00023184 [Aphis craccivora]|uniref:Uncharacterized protein n=1 Tax=Aphis craccivora TaxID=307492 RepID=A0A6G0YA75_APHCR|nr:Uncharacterized protein FWK35_00023184 [Aphis craccivora]